MLGENTKRFLSISSPPLGPTVALDPQEGLVEWAGVMSARNGFVAFESALLVRPAICDHPALSDVKAWNSPNCWLNAYEFTLPKMLFFAEDVFGEQFAILGDSIVRFDPETGDHTWLATTFDDWAKLVCDHYNEETGFSLGREWQAEHGALALGERLLPRVPFVLGGEYTLSNLKKWNDRKGMRARGFLATKLQGVPDGAQVSFVLEE